MTAPPATIEDDEPGLAADPRGLRSYDLGLLAGLAAAGAYGLSAELIGLTWGLVAVAFIGGMAIGAAVTRGAWQGRPHIPVRRIQVMAALIGAGAWVVGVFLAYAISQALLPQASTPLLDRLSFGQFANYFTGLDESLRLIHLASLAALSYMAWRGAK